MHTLNNQRVLFVDDEEGVRHSWDRFLTERGFDVTAVEDGTRAISHLRQEPVDVVVADLRMPGVDGLQLLQWLHDSRPDTRFILLTGYGNEEIERKARELGAYEYLNKPISPETLSAIITAATQLDMVSPAKAVAPKALDTPDTKPVPRITRARRALADHPNLEIAVRLILGPVIGLALVVLLPLIGMVILFYTLFVTIMQRWPRSAEPPDTASATAPPSHGWKE